ADLGDAEAGDREHLHEAGRHLLPELLEEGGSPGVGHLLADLEGGRADALRGRERALGERGAEAAADARQRLGGGADGADADRVLALELEERRDLLQDLRGGAPVGGGRGVGAHAAAPRRQASSRNSSPPVSDRRPAASPPARTGLKSGVPSGRTSSRGRGPSTSTTVKPGRPGCRPKTPSARSPSGNGCTKKPSSGSAGTPGTASAHSSRGGSCTYRAPSGAPRSPAASSSRST